MELSSVVLKSWFADEATCSTVYRKHMEEDQTACMVRAVWVRLFLGLRSGPNQALTC
jgi:hypothetical protein